MYWKHPIPYVACLLQSIEWVHEFANFIFIPLCNEAFQLFHVYFLFKHSMYANLTSIALISQLRSAACASRYQIDLYLATRLNVSLLSISWTCVYPFVTSCALYQLSDFNTYISTYSWSSCDLLVLGPISRHPFPLGPWILLLMPVSICLLPGNSWLLRTSSEHLETCKSWNGLMNWCLVFPSFWWYGQNHLWDRVSIEEWEQFPHLVKSISSLLGVRLVVAGVVPLV